VPGPPKTGAERADVMTDEPTPADSRRPPRRRWWWLGAIVLIVVIAGWLALRGSRRPQPQPPIPAPTPTATAVVEQRLQLSETLEPGDTNIVLITLDTLRSDRLSCYGSERVDTPNIDRFADEGVRFTDAAGTVPFTLPAHSSILTGLYPPGHGVRENVGYVLDDELPTLATILKQAGWDTAGFVSAFVLDGRWGIDHGFDHYFDDFDISKMDSRSLSSVQRSGDETVAEAVRWLDERRSERPFFLWLHLYDPHEPYEPPEPYKTRYPERPYDGEVAYTDSLIGDFRAALEERDLLDRSLVILTSDHGEGLGDHGERFHGYFIYETTIHVALIVRLPDADHAGRVVDRVVSHVDLMPTVLDAVRLDPPPVLHGRSLLPLLLGQDTPWNRSVYSESLYPLLHYGWSPLRAIRTDRFKLIDVPRPELYDLDQDLLEEENLHDQQPERSTELQAALDELRAAIERDADDASQQADLDEQTLAQLQALGYVAGQGGVSVDQEQDRPRADPKDKLVLHQKMMAAQSRMGGEALDDSRRLLEQVLAEDSEIIDAHQMLGQIAAQQDRFSDAAEHFQRALAIDPDHRNSLFGLASSYAALDRHDEALIGFRRLLDIAGTDTKTSVSMADIYIERRQFDQAAAVLEEAVSDTFAVAFIHNKLGEVRVEQGRPQQAIPLFERAIEKRDDFAMPYFNLAALLEERRDVRRAIELYERSIELAPRFHKALFNLGRLYGETGEPDRQQELWQASIESNPRFVQGHYYLAKLLMDRGGDLERAEELVRRGIELDPEHEEGPLGYYVLADLLNRTGRPAEARRAVAMGREIQASMER
jgi:arylsulfatase A-like enzyme/Tfp pilus assembly protein PilF